MYYYYYYFYLSRPPLSTRSTRSDPSLSPLPAPQCPPGLDPAPPQHVPGGASGASTGQQTPPLLLGLARASLRTKKMPVEH